MFVIYLMTCDIPLWCQCNCINKSYSFPNKHINCSFDDLTQNQMNVTKYFRRCFFSLVNWWFLRVNQIETSNYYNFIPNYRFRKIPSGTFFFLISSVVRLVDVEWILLFRVNFVVCSNSLLSIANSLGTIESTKNNK